MAWSALPFRQPGQNTQKLYCKKMLEVAGGSPTHWRLFYNVPYTDVSLQGLKISGAARASLRMLRRHSPSQCPRM